ncbi:MAG: efflux RND transporter permease subunit, partial [Blastomonas sp.]|nr:efflux RND transporter permease subunit [Blastomonas sp.]
LGASAALCGVGVLLYAALPKEFAPTEDRGVVIIPTTGPEGASFGYTMEHVTQIERLLQRYVDNGEAAAVFATVGGFQRPAVGNIANIFIRLAPWAERSRKQQEIPAAGFPRISQNPGSRGLGIGLFNLTNTAPSLIMPWIAISMVPDFGYASLFLVLALLALAAALLLISLPHDA